MENSDTYQLLGRIDANVATLLERSLSHDKRITAVEHKQWWVTGAAACAVVLLPFLPDLKTLF